MSLPLHLAFNINGLSFQRNSSFQWMQYFRRPPLSTVAPASRCSVCWPSDLMLSSSLVPRVSKGPFRFTITAGPSTGNQALARASTLRPYSNSCLFIPSLFEDTVLACPYQPLSLLFYELEFSLTLSANLESKTSLSLDFYLPLSILQHFHKVKLEKRDILMTFWCSVLAPRQGGSLFSVPFLSPFDLSSTPGHWGPRPRRKEARFGDWVRMGTEGIR